MKLFTRYNRVNIGATIVVFVLGSIAFYFVLHYVLIKQLNDTLRSEQQEIVEYVQEHGQLPEIQNTRHQWITVSPTTDSIPRKPHIKSIFAYNQREQEQESVRQLVFLLKVGSQYYFITVNKSEAETEDLLQFIILVTVGMIALILLFNYIINRKLVSRLWQPFYTTIDSIKDYHPSVREPLQLSRGPIDELALLNDSLNQMTAHIYHDYQALKSFTENASHEMQTPLAVIRSKVEVLLQDTEGKQQSMQQLLAIEDATQKLSMLNRSLLLLTKLENRQFSLNEPVNLKKIFENRLEERQHLIESKQLRVMITGESPGIFFHEHLAEILVNNLLNNAIRYTPPAGGITIELNKDNLVVSNTASGGSLDTTKVFRRFYKANEAAQEGTGLGLAIIKEICNAAGFMISYQFKDGYHIFNIHFKS